MDTSGIGDETVLGQKRMKRTDEVISKTDIGVLVVSDTQTGPEREMLKKFKDTPILLVINKIDLLSEEEIKKDDSFLQGTIYDLYRQNYSYSQEDIAKNDAAFLLDLRTIREIAKNKKAVIFGKCSDFVLEDFPKISIFIYTSSDFKEERILNTYNAKNIRSRIESTKEKSIPITNYGIVIAYFKGILDKINY
ncbi:cytidylate kinase family protein [Peptoniphilus gorbachii]|uniref:GTPase SAR1 family protein n=1 Tax=Peptoniphilus gorbachii TaxID=411567 RepID=A0ABS2MK83_9FIRM|nr:cytidylate kinase family protein [Peptoniphilus gorbachii]MBM7550431.1 GTPase SAR1 family protein [Peptoniphilus gorbachii]